MDYSGIWVAGLAAFAAWGEASLPSGCLPPWGPFLSEWDHSWSPVGDVDGDGRDDLVLVPYDPGVALIVTDVCDP